MPSPSPPIMSYWEYGEPPLLIGVDIGPERKRGKEGEEDNKRAIQRRERDEERRQIKPDEKAEDGSTINIYMLAFTF